MDGSSQRAHFRGVMNRRQQPSKGPDLFEKAQMLLEIFRLCARELHSRMKASEVWKRGWRTEGVGARRPSIAMPQVQTSFPHSFSYAPLGVSEGDSLLGTFFFFNAFFFQGAPKEPRRGRAEKRLSKRVFLESPFLLCSLKVFRTFQVF